MAGTEIMMTAEALDRLQKVTRMRERARIAEKIDGLAAIVAAGHGGAGSNDTTASLLFAFGEELRTEGVPVKVASEEQVAQANELEAERVDAIVAQEEAEAGDALPEVHHRDDMDEGVALVSNLAARRAMNQAGGTIAGMMRD